MTKKLLLAAALAAQTSASLAGGLGLLHHPILIPAPPINPDAALPHLGNPATPVLLPGLSAAPRMPLPDMGALWRLVPAPIKPDADGS